jgi:hypothetical protein
MPLFAIHRVLDPQTPPDERELMVVRSIGFVETPLRPTWRRTFAIQTDAQFETWCMYDGRSAEELEWWNTECHVPFNEVRPVTQWRRQGGLTLEDGESIHWVRGTRPAGEPSETYAAALSEAAEHPAAKCLRIYCDDERGHVYAALAARDSASAVALAETMGLPCEQVDVVDEIRPTDFAALYENVGFTPYSGDD